MALTISNNLIYKPKFNENTDKYDDCSPYIKYQRNCQIYECRCKAGVILINNASYNKHIKNKTHKEWIKNYSKYYKEVDDANEIIKDKNIEIEKLKRKLQKKEKEYNELLKQLKGVIDDSEFHDC